MKNHQIKCILEPIIAPCYLVHGRSRYWKYSQNNLKRKFWGRVGEGGSQIPTYGYLIVTAWCNDFAFLFSSFARNLLSRTGCPLLSRTGGPYYRVRAPYYRVRLTPY